MKATQKDFPAICQRAAQQCSVFFFCGPDEAGAAAAAAQVAGLLTDPGERVEISGSDLRKDPVLLGDEARSVSLFGEARHIWVRANGDEVHDALANMLEGEGEACPVFVVASAATDKSRTAKLLEKRDNALVAMFWPPDLRSVTASVRAMGDAAGLTMGGDIAERVARSAGLDVRLAQSEVTKLAIYLDASPANPRSVDPQTLDAIGARTEEDGFMPLVNAVLSGETGKLSGELSRMREMSLNPVGLLLAFERRAAQLAQISAHIGPRSSIRDAVEAEKKARRVFWKDVRDIEAQLRCWRGKKLDRLVEKLVGLHRAMLSNNQSAEMLLAQGLAEIARFARAGN